ncbi:hypothetical protein Tco_0704814 [Tanacetum coccineum]|uniref:Uncharacterized protein n=1 Tax=Tanacetum coccineum TaxID=301880 RepID=A0ABQ4Y4T8_9ASTR
MKELYDKVQESIKDSFKDFIPMGSEKERLWLQERNAKRLSRKRKATISEEQPSKKLKLRMETVDELRNYLRIVDFEKNAQDRESLEGISMITELQVIDSPDGEYLIIHRANNHFRAFDTLWEILHVLDRQDLYHLYRVVDDYYEHIPPTGLGLMLLGDLTIIWETAESSDDDFWKDQEEWEIIRWRFHESSGVHTLEIEDGTMIHMLAERRYPLSRELMIRMLDHGMEVEDETETAITLIHLFILWTTEDGITILHEPTPTQDTTFKQLEEERLGWEAAQRLQAQELADFEKQRVESLMKDDNLARQMSQDFEMTEAQRKRQQEVLASAANYSDAAWDIILARLQENPDLTSIIFGVEFTDDDFAARMVELVNTRRKELAEQRAQERRERPMTPSQLRQYMRTYVKNQGPAVYSTGWTMAQVRKLSPEQLQEEFDKIQRAVAFTRGFKRDGSPMTRASSKKLKTGGDDVNLEVPSHGVPQEEAGATPSQNVSQEEVAAPSHSQDIPQATQLKFHLTLNKLEASTAQTRATSLKKCWYHRKNDYASDAMSPSDDDTPVNFYDVVDWELLPTGLGSINVFYRKDNSRKCFTSLREILHLVTRADLMTIYGRVMTFYQDKKAAGIGLVLWGDLKVLMDSPEVNDGSDVWKNQQTWKIQSWKLYSYSGVHVLETVSGLVVHMFVDKKYPLSVNLIERMLDHQLEICHGTMGNELTTAVQLIAFLKKQISDSRRPKVHDCCGGLHVAVKEYAFGFKVLLFNPLVLSKTDLSRNLKYVVPTGRVKVPAGRYVVPTGKDNVIVSTGRTKVIPAVLYNLNRLEDLSRAGPTVKEGQKGFYHLIRVDGSSNRYSSMIRMLQNISREDLETLWKLVKTKHGNTRPEDVYEKVFWGDLKVMFEPDIKSKIWRSLQGYKVTVWKLFDSSGVHFVRFKNLHIFITAGTKVNAAGLQLLEELLLSKG